MKRLIIAIIIINLLLLGSQLVLANFRAGDGSQIAKLESQTHDLTLLNNELESAVYTASSLSTIQVKAQSADLRPISTIPLATADLAAALPVLRP